MQKTLEEILNNAKEQLNNATSKQEVLELKAKYLGKKSEISEVLSKLKDATPEEKKEIGMLVHKVKSELEQDFKDAIISLEQKQLEAMLASQKHDLTLQVDSDFGSIHPIEQVIQEQIDIFTKMGYEVIQGPEIESTRNIFDMLNTPKDHPAREMQDTFYINESLVLRSQTSAIQIRKMLKENGVVKMICPGRVYRSDSVDATHSPVFHQLEGLVIGENVSMADLHGTLKTFLSKALDNASLRFRPHHFPYTEPSAEVDVTCFMCKGKGCSTCKKEGYIELLGCGMVHPNVIRNCGLDPEKYSGFAFGFGIERIAMAKFKISDLRLLYENDVKVLEQFK